MRIGVISDTHNFFDPQIPDLFHGVEHILHGGLKFLLHHIVAPHDLDEPLRRRINRAKPDVVVFGHTHKPFAERLGGVLYFNPGYAGKMRFGMERTVAILECGAEDLTWQYHML